MWVSSEKKVSKIDGEMWKVYKNRIVKSRTALHIGDDENSDIKSAKKQDISTYYIMNAISMLNRTVLKEISHQICTQYQSLVMGTVMSRMFNSPFALNEGRGKILLKDIDSLGYCLFGPTICTFLIWLLQQTLKKNVKNVFFFARDGYFLEKIYQEIIKDYPHEFPNSYYLPISRQLIWMASLETEKDLEDLLAIPYEGTFSEYMLKRFDVSVSKITEEVNQKRISAFYDIKELKKYVFCYKEEIYENASRDYKNYKDFLKNFSFKERFAIVDLGFHGTIQKYFSKFLRDSITGYYFVTDQECKSSFNGISNEFYTCFSYKGNKNRSHCVADKILIMESFLTAPYGMIRRIDEKGNPVFGEEFLNQKFFDDKKEILKGIMSYVDDFFKVLSLKKCHELLNEDIDFIDAFFGKMLSNGVVMSEKVKRSFYYSNETMRSVGENRIFE